MVKKKSDAKKISKEIEKKLTLAILKSLKESAMLVEAQAAIYTPVMTGNLRASITHEVNPQELKAYIFTRVKYAPMVEYGTAKMVAAHGEHNPEHPVKKWEAKEKRGNPANQQMPFMRPALLVNVDNIKKIFAKNINEIK